MWGDYEAKNKLLEDLLVEYAQKLDTREKEIQRLRRKLRDVTEERDYLAKHSWTGSILHEPTIVEVPHNINTISIAVPTSPEVSVSLENRYDGAYHVVAKIRNSARNHIQFSYAITKQSLLQAADRLGILTYLHKKVLEEIERDLDKQPKGL